MLIRASQPRSRRHCPGKRRSSSGKFSPTRLVCYSLAFSHGYPNNARYRLTSEEWHQITLKDDTLQIVSRLSSRVFMGEELCRDEEWIRASREYTAYIFPLQFELGLTPRWARPFVHWFRPDCWRLRSLQAECRRALKPHLERRKALKKAALARGESLVFDDSIEWWEKERPKIMVDPAMQQITMSLVAIHTTADLLQQVMIDLALHPELFQPLREELVRVLSAEGLKKTALYNLKLMDSVCKETQRLKPILLGKSIPSISLLSCNLSPCSFYTHKSYLSSPGLRGHQDAQRLGLPQGRKDYYYKRQPVGFGVLREPARLRRLPLFEDAQYRRGKERPLRQHQ